VAFGPVSKQRHRVAVPTHCEVGGGFVWAPQGYVSPPSAAMPLSSVCCPKSTNPQLVHFVRSHLLSSLLVSCIESFHSAFGDAKRGGNAAPATATRLSHNPTCLLKDFSRSDKNEPENTREKTCSDIGISTCFGKCETRRSRESCFILHTDRDSNL